MDNKTIIIETINNNNILKLLNDDEKEKVSKIISIRQYPKNSFLFWQNECSNAAYIIQKGLVKLYRTYRNENIRILELKTRHEFVSEFSILFPYEHLFTAMTLSPTSILVFNLKKFNDIIKHNDKLVSDLKISILNNIKNSFHEIEQNLFNNIPGIVAFKLIYLAEKFGKKTERGTLINLKLSQKELADMVGTNRETICKCLVTFRKERSISISNKLITILNFNTLKKWQ